MAVMDREPFTWLQPKCGQNEWSPPPFCQPSFIFPNIFNAKNHKCQLFTGFSHFISSHLWTRRSFQRYWCSCSNFVRHELHAIEILKTLTSCFLVRVPDRDCIFKLWPKEHMLGLFLEGLEFILWFCPKEPNRCYDLTDTVIYIAIDLKFTLQLGTVLVLIHAKFPKI